MEVSLMGVREWRLVRLDREAAYWGRLRAVLISILGISSCVD